MAAVKAILLIGPTGSGKTPLGDLLQRRPLWGGLCVHFDFGAELRRVAAGDGAASALTEAQVEVVLAALAADALLEDAQFPIAEAIFRAFLDEAGPDEDTPVVLNGLPRHVGQARAVDGLVDIEVVIQLDCPAEVTVERIGANAAGDRAGRMDDDIISVARKLEIFRARTAPLVEQYRRAGARIETVSVSAADLPEDILTELNGRGPTWPGRRSRHA